MQTHPTSSERLQLTYRFLRHVFLHWHAFVGMLICMVVVGAVAPMLPLLLAPLIDAGSGGKDYLLPAMWIPYAFFLTAVVQSVFSYGRGYLGGWLDVTLQRDFRNLMAAHLLRLPVAHLQKESTGLITSRFMLFLPTVTGSVMPVCMALIQETIKVSGYIIVMFYWQWKLALLVLTIAPIVALMIRYLRQRMKKVAHLSQQTAATGQSRLNETMQLTPVIKIQGETQALRWLNDAFSGLRGAALRVSVVLSASQPLTHLLLAIPITFVIAYITGALIDGKMTAGTASAFLTTMILLPTPVRNLTRAVSTWEQMLAAAREVFYFLDLPPETDTGNLTLTTRAHGALAFENVSFRYDSESSPLVLNNFSLSVTAGETVALVGRSGAGKTTITNLLPRFYTPHTGVIHLDGDDINDITLQSLRQQITLITQEPLLFDDTVAMNVAYPDDGTQHPTRIMTALKNAASDEFVQALPQGVNTRIGENGDTLSGGQRQRLALARAFYRDTPIVILDEATSALDSETEKTIKESMRRLLTKRTALIIAHRFATIDFADRVAVLDEGRIIAVGTVQELRQTCPLFAELYNAQILQ